MIKRITTATLTTLLVAGSVTFAKSEETKKATKNAVTKVKELKTCTVSESEVVTYLEGFGYSNITFYRTSSPCQMYVSTDYSYDTIIYLSGNNIIGHEDTE